MLCIHQDETRCAQHRTRRVYQSDVHKLAARGLCTTWQQRRSWIVGSLPSVKKISILRMISATICGQGALTLMLNVLPIRMHMYQCRPPHPDTQRKIGTTT